MIAEQFARPLKISGLWELYREKSFENYNVAPENKRAYDTARAYAQKFRGLIGQGKGLYLSGPSGTGKTHLAAATAIELAQAGYRICCGTGIELLGRIRQSYDDRGMTEYDLLGDYLAADLLIIDDLGKEAVTEWSLSMLYAIVNLRTSNCRPILVTTNYTDEQLIRRLGRTGDTVTAAAIVSRLHEVCYGVELGGEDYRSKGGKK